MKLTKVRVAQRLSAEVEIQDEIQVGAALQFAQKRWFVSGHRFSDAVNALRINGALGAEGPARVLL
jgi:hypothetical protein